MSDEKKEVVRCDKCGLHKADHDEQGIGCVGYEYGPGNSASPSGAYPVSNGSHEWVLMDGCDNG